MSDGIRTDRLLLGCLGNGESVAVVPQDLKKGVQVYFSVVEDTFLFD